MERLVGVGRFLRPYWMPLALATVLLLAGILGAAPNYGKLQTAADDETFRLLVAADVGGYTFAARIDLLFATGYGLLALVALAGLKEWSGRFVGVARLGCCLVFAGAILDQGENVMLLVNIANRDRIGDVAIDIMTTLGTLKWIAAGFGVVLLLVGLVVRGLWPTMQWADVLAWTRKAWKPYSIYLGLVLLFVVLVLARWRWPAFLALCALGVVGIWLNRVVSASRKEEREAATDLGPARLALTLVQLTIGIALFGWGVPERSGPVMTEIPGSDAVIAVRDIFAVVGLAVVIISLGSLISELRQNTRFEHQRSRVLFIAAIGLVAAGGLVGAGTMMLVLVGVAVLLGEVATELAAADRLRGEPAVGSQHVRWIALPVVGALGWVALVGIGADRWHAAGIVVALSILVLLALWDGDALLVVAVLGLLVLFATTPYEVELEESLLPAADQPYILVLGDSYTSGEGAQQYLPGTNEARSGPATATSVNECRQAPTAWGFEVARLAAADAIGDGDTPFPTRVLFVACSGAVSENIDTKPRRGSDDSVHGPAELLLYEQYAEREGLGHPSLVIVGIGGNDGGFGDLGQTCVGPGNCAKVAQQFLENRPERLIDPPGEGQSEALVDIGDDLDKAFANIERVVGDGVPIVATSYPEPVATSHRRCAGALLGADERVFINGFATQLNVQIRAAAERAGISFMNISGALAEGGSQLCADSPTPGLNFLAFGSKGGTLRDSLNPKNWSHNSLHPSTEGHRLFAAAAYEWFETNWPLRAPVVDEVQAPTVEQFLRTLGVEQCRPQDDRLCSVEHGTWLTEQATSLFRTAILPVGALVFALFLVLLPLVARPSTKAKV